MSQQRSEAQKAASRANGAKSRGPSTPEGIERCRRAATLHGMYTPQILLANEDPAKYKRLLDSYIAEWNPLGITERDILTDMVNARWRIRRIWGQTSGLINAEMLFSQDRTDASYEPVTAELRQCDGICELEKALPGMLNRMQTQETSLKRLFSRSMKELIQLQKMRLGELPTLVPQPSEDEIFFPPESGEPIDDTSPSPDETPPTDEPSESEPAAIDDQAVCPSPEIFHQFSTYFSYDQDGEPRTSIFARHARRNKTQPEDFPQDQAA